MTQIAQVLRWKLDEKHRDGWKSCNWAAVVASYDIGAEEWREHDPKISPLIVRCSYMGVRKWRGMTAGSEGFGRSHAILRWPCFNCV